MHAAMSEGPFRMWRDDCSLPDERGEFSRDHANTRAAPAGSGRGAVPQTMVLYRLRKDCGRRCVSVLTLMDQARV
jgi:hypothetical protein